MKVMKFGGSTIKDPDMISQVGRIIQNENEVKGIVVSALHGQTNEIREYVRKIRTECEEIDSFIYRIRKRHEDMAKAVIPDSTVLGDILSSLDFHILKLERLLYGVAYTEELTPRTSDLILSSGERMSAFIMEGVLRSMGLNAKAFEADRIGIATDGVFLNATADLEKTQENLAESLIPHIRSDILPVITGFFGCDSQGRTTTFGKNGSDYSAAVIACALNADSLELWKDVDGFLSADPGLIKNAYTIKNLSYDEAAELAYFGIGILHPRTVGPVRAKKIPIMIRNIHKPNGQGTTIQNSGEKSQNGIKSVVYSNDLVEIRISGTGGGYRSGVLGEVSGVLGANNINIYSVSTSQTSLSILIARSDKKGCLKALGEVRGGVIEQISSHDDIALVCVVGEGAREIKGLAAKIFTAVSDSGVNVEIISAGASHAAAHFVINKEGLQRAVSAIHRSFCEN